MTNKNQQISKLLELNEELENYFSNTIIPQLFVDANLILRKFTPPAMKQFSLQLTDVGKHFSEIHENFRFPTIIDNIEQVISNGEILEKEIQTTDLRWYQMNILPYKIRKENKTNGVIITFVEITMRIKDLKDQELLIAEHEILLDTISHDIKTPLTSLSLTIDLLKQLPDKGMEKFPLLLQKVENSLVKMQDILGDLTDSRQHTHRYKGEEELLDFQNILEDVRLTLAPQILAAKASIKSDIQASEITFARRKLRSVIYNLINNAIKYGPVGRAPEILISTRKLDGFIEISVTDNGIGIAKEDQDKIFTKYSRIELSVEGTGIGLYLVHEIVKSGGGTITVQSEPGKGSTFTVCLKA
jgi:two-component system phosphate regulon sensor histidine kinase PhoR